MVKKVGWLLHSLLILYSVGKWEEKVIDPTPKLPTQFLTEVILAASIVYD